MVRFLRSSMLLGCFAGAAVGQDSSEIYAAKPTTPKGCVCTSACATDALFGCFSEQVCSVASKDCANGTAQYSVTKGYWDYCEHTAYTPYESLTAAQKQAILMKHIVADSESGVYPSTLAILPGVMTESVRVSLEAQSDIFTEPRTKYIHSVGAVAPIVWESTGNHSYAGLFASGAKHGLMRFSSANSPDPTAGFTPGVGLKLLRDGRPSANFFAMPGLAAQSCSASNFFERDFNTHVMHAGNFVLDKVIARKFWQASYCPLMVGTSDLADGSDHFPFMLKLKPTNSVVCPCEDYRVCLSNLQAKLTPGTEVFEVHAQASPSADFELIARIRVGDSSPTPTKFGDTQLFFKHQAMEQDFQRRPEWLEQIDKEGQCGMKTITTTRPGPEQGCTSPIEKILQRDSEMII